MYPPSGTHSHSYAEDTAIVRTKFQWVLLTALLLFLFAFPHLPILGSEYMVRVVIEIGYVIIAVHGLNLLTGYCGQINLGQAAFMLVGGFVSGLLTYVVGWSFWLAMPFAGIASATAGLIFGIPSLRVKGLYLALTTFAAQIILSWVCLYQIPMGSTGFEAPAPRLGGLVFDTSEEYYYLVMAFCVLFTFFAKNIARSGVGRAFVAIRDNDKASESIGMNSFYYKLLAFAVCAFYAGIAGSLAVHYLAWVQVDNFTLLDSIWYVGMLIIGGMGTAVGPVLGVITLTLLKEGMSIVAPTVEQQFGFLSIGAGSGITQFVFGAIIVLFLVFEPRGLAHRWEVLKASVRLWPFAH